MAIPVEMPKMSDTMEEGVLVAWLVDEGAEVSAGDVIAQVETDKATMDLEVYDDGVLLARVIQEGDAVPIGGLIAVLGKAGEDISEVLARFEDGGRSPAAATADRAEDIPVTAEAVETPAPAGDGAAEPDAIARVSVRAPGGRVKASPLARRLASEHGLDLAVIAGSGPEGRIIKRDVQAAMKSGAAGPALQAVDYPQDAEPEIVRISQMRKAVARRLSQSKFTAPHFYVTVDVDMDRAHAFRSELNAVLEEQGGAKVSFNDLITRACGLALRKHPAVNASYFEDRGEIHRHRQVHVAVAVAIDEGLITPVIRHADRKSFGEIAVETKILAEKARNRQLQPEDYEGSTFTTSNLGMFGIEEFTAIINPPNAAILAIGSVRDEAVAREGGVVVGKRMKLTLSCDHRVVDGATGAEFLKSLQAYLEKPVGMLL